MFPSSTAKESLTVGPRGASCFHGLKLWERAPRLKDWEEIINQSDTLNAGIRSRNLPLSPSRSLSLEQSETILPVCLISMYLFLPRIGKCDKVGGIQTPRELTAAA